MTTQDIAAQLATAGITATATPGGVDLADGTRITPLGGTWGLVLGHVVLGQGTVAEIVDALTA
ncbi:hypothetical protein [Stackebrandtia soli]|uniref:hypothetical protein n=1 Tax=Stackebrandtia soli TaxID=1892856 RepID=UPI0039ED9A7C